MLEGGTFGKCALMLCVACEHHESLTALFIPKRTYFPEAREIVRLDFGEFLLHPGSVVHSGANIGSGTRHLMVIFAQIS